MESEKKENDLFISVRSKKGSFVEIGFKKSDIKRVEHGEVVLTNAYISKVYKEGDKISFNNQKFLGFVIEQEDIINFSEDFINMFI